MLWGQVEIPPSLAAGNKRHFLAAGVALAWHVVCAYHKFVEWIREWLCIVSQSGESLALTTERYKAKRHSQTSPSGIFNESCLSVQKRDSQSGKCAERLDTQSLIAAWLLRALPQFSSTGEPSEEGVAVSVSHSSLSTFFPFKTEKFGKWRAGTLSDSAAAGYRWPCKFKWVKSALPQTQWPHCRCLGDTWGGWLLNRAVQRGTCPIILESSVGQRGSEKYWCLEDHVDRPWRDHRGCFRKFFPWIVGIKTVNVCIVHHVPETVFSTSHTLTYWIVRRIPSGKCHS